MQFNRTKNAKRNIVFSLILKIYQIAMPFLIRTLFIYIMGVEYLGLNSLFSSVLQVLNLAELGVGTAMVYAMFKPVAEDDTETICALMRMYRRYYRIIGIVVLVAGLIVTPFLPYLIESDLPADVNLYVLWFLNLASTVVTYWLFAYKNCIIHAHQRDDINSKISLGITTLTYIGQILILLLTHNYYLYIVVSIVTNLLSNIVTKIVADKMYPQYQPRGDLPKESVKQINKRVRDLFTSKIGSVVTYSVDTIVISAFLGLTILAEYQNYYYIFSSVAGLVNLLTSSIVVIVGNSIIVESKEKNYRDFKCLFFIMSWIAGFCSVCFLCLYQPFMELWLGQEYMLEFGIVICFSVYFFVYIISNLLSSYKDASGMWHSDRFRPLVVSLANLAINLLLVNYIGLYGIILSTVLTMALIGYPWLLWNLFHEIFDPKHLKHIVLYLVLYMLITAGVAAVTYFICSFVSLPLVWTVVVDLLICIFVSNILFFMIYFWLPDFRDSAIFLNDKVLKGKITFLVKLLNRNKKVVTENVAGTSATQVECSDINETDFEDETEDKG